MYKILLIGGEFVNKGAEAMIFSTKSLLEKYSVDPEIVVATYEKKNVGTEYQGLTIIGNKWLKGKAILYVKLLIPIIGKKLVKGNLLRRYEEADVVINIGGFSLSDKQSLQGNILYCIEIMLCRLMKKPFASFPQDMGPFRTPLRRFLVKRYLPKAKVIFVRSEKSKKYLDEIGIKNVHVSPDLAFNFQPSNNTRVDKIMSDCEIPKKPFICIIPNMRVYERNNEYIDSLSHLVDFICDTFKINVLLLPHEFKHDKKDDRFVIEKIIDNIKHKDRVFQITREYPACDLKGIISKADILISSRFHGAIAGLSTCVPTMVIGWAHKYRELMASVGQEEFALDYQNINIDNITEKLTYLNEHKKEIKKELESIIPKIKQDAEQPALLLKKMLSKDVGKFKNTYLAYSSDKDIRKAGQSGGVISSLLIYALEKKIINGAIVTRWSKDDPLKPEMFVATSKDEILQAIKSKYCPVSTEKIFKEIKNIEGKIAFVGTPCQMHKLKKLEKKDKKIKEKIILHFGLFCTGVMSYKFQEYILSVAGIRKQDVINFTYKKKKSAPLSIELKNGETKTISNQCRLKLKPLFTPDECYSCRDRLNGLSDISFGDPWIPEFRDDKLGTSMIVSRTDAGDNLLNEMKHNGVIKLDEIEPHKVAIAQKMYDKNKKKTFTSYTLAKIRSTYYRFGGNI